MRQRWVYINGEAIPADQFEPEPKADHHIMPDIQPYQSMCDGTMVMGRRQHREHLKVHGVVEVGNEALKPRADLRKSGVKDALVSSLQRAKEQYGSRFVERQISEALNRAHEMRRR